MRRSPLEVAVAISLLAVLQAQANWVQRPGAVAPPGRFDHGFAPGPNGTILLFGGTRTVELGDTWILDGAGWRQAITGVAPSPRAAAGMAFDMLRERTVLFGGRGPTSLSDTWEWDGGTWIGRATRIQPPPRSRCAMDYDLARGTVVLFGGLSDSGPMNDTWEWDGFGWTQKNTLSAPVPRYASAMVFDLASLRMLLFGGLSLAYWADTWEYDGVDWQQRNPMHPPPGRGFCAMAFDWQRNRVVLFGGASDSNYDHADTWEWDGADWLQRTPAVSPPGRSSCLQVLDLARNRIVLFGGLGFGLRTTYADTWEYFSTAVPSIATLASGCAGSVGIPWLATPLPWLGDALHVTAYATPPGAPALLALGLSSTTWGTLSLPASLAAFGMPGCSLAVSGDATIAMTGAIPACTLTLPPNNAFAGMPLFAQALVVDPTANAAGCVLSSALALQLGAR